MAVKRKVAINGFGRIGRLAARVIITSFPDMELVAVNDLTSSDNLAYLFSHDTTYHTFPFPIRVDGDHICVGQEPEDIKIKVFSETDPSKLPWAELGVDIVLECTGVFLTQDLAKLHIKAGAKKVVLSAPAKDDQTNTIVLGVNHSDLDKPFDVISNASCTTNCVAPVLRVLVENFAVQEVVGMTAHAYTATQVLQDGPSKKDFRDGRAAAVNLIPSKTGAAKAVIKVLPELENKLALMSLRVPVITGSMVFLSVNVSNETTVENVNNLLNQASQTYLKDILEYSQDELVSSDIIGNSKSVIVDSKLTEVIGKTIKLVVWYDNEWGYANRLVELAKLIKLA